MNRNHPGLGRRKVLRGLGVALALPSLEAMRPAITRASTNQPPRRMLAICNNLGVLSTGFFPKDAGRDYQLSPYLEHLKDHRNDFTVMSGVWHPGVDGGHPADICFLSAAPHPSSGGFRNSISLDQFAAQQIGHLTRFPSLTLGVNIKSSPHSLSWTAGGVLIPCEEQPSALYRRLFMRGNPDEVAAQIRRLALGRSALDAVADQAKRVKQGLPTRDLERLDQYYTGVRELEQRMAKARLWEDIPKPTVTVPEPEDPTSPRDYFLHTRLMYDLSRLAFETDSTRLITLMLHSVNTPVFDVPGIEVKDGYHSLSHHGKSEEKLTQLDAIDREHMNLLNGLFHGLKETQEDGVPLLDRTMVLYGSNMGDANLHTTTNLPVLLAGGGFRHGQHLAFDHERNYPLPNLFVNMLQRMGIETDRFATSTGTMRGIEAV